VGRRSVAPDAAWTEFQRNGDRSALAGSHALFFRATFAPTLAAAIDLDRGADARQAFADRLAPGLRARVAATAAAVDLSVASVLLAMETG
jgi:hypothetical protein